MNQSLILEILVDGKVRTRFALIAAEFESIEGILPEISNNHPAVNNPGTDAVLVSMRHEVTIANQKSPRPTRYRRWY